MFRFAVILVVHEHGGGVQQETGVFRPLLGNGQSGLHLVELKVYLHQAQPDGRVFVIDIQHDFVNIGRAGQIIAHFQRIGDFRPGFDELGFFRNRAAQVRLTIAVAQAQ